MLNPAHVRAHIVRPVLTALEMGGASAEAISMGTIAKESHFQSLVQIGGGPGCGLGQVEPLTGQDVLHRYLGEKRPDLLARFARAVELVAEPDPAALLSMSLGQIRLRLISDLRFNCAVMRVRYWFDPEPLPPADDIPALGAYWDRVYNVNARHGTADEFVAAWHECGLDEVIVY